MTDCRWTEDDEGNFDTDCGEKYTFLVSGPTANGMKWCCYCGKPLVEVPWAEAQLADEDDVEPVPEGA